MTWSWLFKPQLPSAPAVTRDIDAEQLTGRAKRLDRLADAVSRRNAKKTYAIGQFAESISDLGEQFIQKFKETDL